MSYLNSQYSKYFDTYISKVLKQLISTNDRVSISTDTKERLNGILYYLVSKIVSQAIEFTKILQHKVIQREDIEKSIQLLIPGELGENGVIEGRKAYEKYLESFKKDQHTKKPRRKQEERASILFPPSLFAKILRKSKMRIAKGTSVYLAATMEYFTAELLEVALYQTKDEKSTRITTGFLSKGIQEDNELRKLFYLETMWVVGSAYMDFLFDEGISIHDKKEIFHYQSSSNTLFLNKEKFREEIVKIFKTNLEENVYPLLQYFLEEYIVDIIRDTASLSKHAEHDEILVSDLKFLCFLKSGGNRAQNYEEDDDSVTHNHLPREF